MEEFVSKLIASGNIWYILAGVGLLLAYKNGYLDFLKPKPVDPKPTDPANPAKPDSGTPVLDLIFSLIKKLFGGSVLIQSVHDPASDDAAIVSLAAVIKKDPETARKLKELL